MKQYTVDAFTGKPFSGNPAAVCVMESWPSEESMINLAMENNLSETAFSRRQIYAYQASKRGGYMHCRMEENNRITISGEAALVAVTEIVAAL